MSFPLGLQPNTGERGTGVAGKSVCRLAGNTLELYLYDTCARG